MLLKEEIPKSWKNTHTASSLKLRYRLFVLCYYENVKRIFFNIFLFFIFSISIASKSIQTKFNVIDAWVKKGLDEQLYSGAQLLVSYKGEIAFYKNFGFTQYEGEKKQVDDHTLYDVASLTKVVVTLPLLLQLVDQGYLDLNDPLNSFYPHFIGKQKNKVLIKDILAHQAGLHPYYLLGEPEANYEASKQKMLTYFLAHDLAYKPKKSLRYSGFGFMIFGDLLERLGRNSLDKMASENIFLPLEMRNTFFSPSQNLWHNIAATEMDITHGRGIIKGSVHDPNAYFMHGLAGNAGLFSTAKDLAKFGRMVINNGNISGKEILSKKLLDLSKKVHAKRKNQIRGLGWQLNMFDIKKTYGHTGYTGTAMLLDDKKELMIIFLTNRVHPTRDTPDFYPHRKALFKTIYQVYDWPDWRWNLNHFFKTVLP